MVSFSSRIVIPDDVLMREVAGESVILNLKTETYYGLDEVGTRMWQTLTQSETVERAYAQLLDEYEVEPEVLRGDLIRLIEELVGHGLLELPEA